jgi:uncharacterized membrane protein YeaQ/YmgE (transglycosylase-associated protein family)
MLFDLIVSPHRHRIVPIGHVFRYATNFIGKWVIFAEIMRCVGKYLMDRYRSLVLGKVGHVITFVKSIQVRFQGKSKSVMSLLTCIEGSVVTVSSYGCVDHVLSVVSQFKSRPQRRGDVLT